jgi:hypothetical protein
LVIYAFPEDTAGISDSEIPRSVKLAGTALPQDIPGIQSDANVLVHVESFDAASRAYTRLSLSTKLPQYFMAGRCVVTVGPAEGASIRYVQQANAGLVVTENSVDALRRCLRLVVCDESVRCAYGESAYAFAIAHHDEARQQGRFRMLLSAAAGRNGRMI